MILYYCLLIETLYKQCLIDLDIQDGIQDVTFKMTFRLTLNHGLNVFKELLCDRFRPCPSLLSVWFTFSYICLDSPRNFFLSSSYSGPFTVYLNFLELDSFIVYFALSRNQLVELSQPHSSVVRASAQKKEKCRV